MKTSYEIYHLEIIKRDKKFKALFDKYGPCPIKPPKRLNVFGSFSKAIIGQQLHGKAATSIWEKFLNLLDTTSQGISPAHLKNKRISTLNKAGLSRAKAAAIKELAKLMNQDDFPKTSEIKKMGNEELISLFTKVKGLGPWTVEMFLIFSLGREDIASAGDFALKKGIMIHKQLPKLPSPKEFLKEMESYSPYRSIVSWYLWRIVEDA